jgi:hypothetical protein
MRDFIEIGSSPAEEDCVQVSRTKPYTTEMIAECKRFRDLIRKKLGAEPEGAELVIKAFLHNFSTYYLVVCYYDSDLPKSYKYALDCEAKAPSRWEEI